MADGEHTGSSPMFLIFVFAIYSLVLIPLTLYKLCGGGGDSAEGVVKTWADKKKEEGVGAKLKRGLSKFGIKLLVAWAVYLLLFWFLSHAAKGLQPFDPFEILKVPSDATDKEIKKAYRQLSLQYHPDKNPDPKAAEYFAEYITKAYRALTDEVARENYKKYGHPDGPQAMSVSVALPEWFFSKDKNRAPIILLVLLFGGIVTPLGIAAAYLTRSNKYSGPNNVMHDTTAMFMHPRVGVRESQALAKIPDTLVYALEFLTLPITPDQGPALTDLRRTILRLHPDLKDKSAFWSKRPLPSLKAHMLLLAHISREEVPPALQKDLNFILTKSPDLLNEMLGVALIPRTHTAIGGWLTPVLGCVEMMQCIVQAVPIASKKQQPLSKSGESPAALLQLPHFNYEILKKLARKKVKTLADLQDMEEGERREALIFAGIRARQPHAVEDQLEEVETMLSAMPQLWVTAQCVVEGAEGEDEATVMEGDIVTCRIQAMITRRRHMGSAFNPDTIKGKAAQAYAPLYPAPKEEQWYFVLGDPSNNATLAMTRKSLLQAEAIGAKYAQSYVAKETGSAVAKLNGGAKKEGGNPLLAGTKFDPFTASAEDAGEALDSSLEELGQTLEFKFHAPRAGTYNLQLYCLPDAWVGCDRVCAIKLKVAEATRAQREGRGGGRGGGLQRSEESDLLMGGGDSEEEGSEGEWEGSEEEAEMDEEEEGEYDTDEEYEGSGGSGEDEGGKKTK